MKQYTSTEVAAIIGKASVTVRVAAARHGGIGQKIGRDWVFTDEDVAKLEALHLGKPRGRNAPPRRAKPAAAAQPGAAGATAATATQEQGQEEKI